MQPRQITIGSNPNYIDGALLWLLFLYLFILGLSVANKMTARRYKAVRYSRDVITIPLVDMKQAK